MGKALLVSSTSGSVGNLQKFNLIGFDSPTPTEALAQLSATEGATFSGLGMRVYAGGSGTNTLRFRDAGADGQQTCEVAGAGAAEDTTNSDVLTAGDLFAINYTDTGTNSSLWAKMNVAFASGHGNFHGCANSAGSVHDVESATRYLPLCGDKRADGNATETQTQWKNRGYTSIEALQVNISANARTNDSVFKNRINGADGSGVITVGAGLTGIFTATGLGDALSDADLINASLALLTGVEDLTITAVVAILKSTTNKSEIILGYDNGLARTASATAHYLPIGGYITSLTALTEANARIKPGFAGVAGNLRCYLSGNTYTGAATLKLMKNGVAAITTTIGAAGGAAWYENTTDTVSFTATDEFSYELDEGTSGSITIRSMGFTFAPPAGGLSIPVAMHQYRRQRS